VLIYVLVVGWFQSFTTPLLIMAAIPFSLVGILPAHAAMGAFFTATSMIGFIAGAGIVVRNSIILVDFVELRVAQGMPLDEAVIDAGAVRFRPMLLTAAAVIVGASVMLFDPIFQGLALALMGAFFTATSMIGFIAGAGIVVRNSIILVDFVELRLKEGMPLAEAVIDAGAVRFRPMALTAAAVVVGAFVILFDPIFQGLAISLMAGEVASLLLSRAAVPVMYYISRSREVVPAVPAEAPVA
jgi:multidrug efflux pump subunit AcrB